MYMYMHTYTHMSSALLLLHHLEICVQGFWEAVEFRAAADVHVEWCTRGSHDWKHNTSSNTLSGGAEQSYH